MSAVATKKPLGELGVLMTFPAVFNQLYDAPYEYFPSGENSNPDIMIGTDFQSHYHEQKKEEARRSVRDGLQARRSAELLLLTGHANYHLPKPVLSQRKFANPMNGTTGFPSSRRDGSVSAPFTTVERQMEGGILSSVEGQQYYRDKLVERSEQLTRINSLAGGQPVPWGSNQSRTFDSSKLGTKDKVEFFLALRNLTDSVESGNITSFNYSDFKDILTKLFRFATYATEEEITKIMRAVDTLLLALGALVDSGDDAYNEIGREAGDEDTTISTKAYAQSLQVLMTRTRDYLTGMMEGVNLQPNDRVALSQNLISSLGFNDAFLYDDERELLERLVRNDPREVRARQRLENIDGWWNDEDDDGDGGDDDDRNADGRWSYIPRTREDEEQDGVERAPFAGRAGDVNRDRFGARNGLFYAPSYYGEGDDMAAPLASSGVEEQNEVARTDPATLNDAADAAIDSVLASLPGYRSGLEGAELVEFIRSSYPDTDDFVAAVVENLDSQGYTPAQIARGVEMTELPFFAEYITENTGEIDPRPAAPAYDWSRRFASMGGMGGLGTSMVPPPQQSAPRLATESGMAPTGFPSAEDREAFFAVSGLPRTRDEFLRTFRSIESLQALGLRLPPPVGVYRVRTSSQPKNVRETIIRKVKQFIDPMY